MCMLFISWILFMYSEYMFIWMGAVFKQYDCEFQLHQGMMLHKDPQFYSFSVLYYINLSRILSLYLMIFFYKYDDINGLYEWGLFDSGNFYFMDSHFELCQILLNNFISLTEFYIPTKST